MSIRNIVFLIGNLGQDPEVRRLESGKSVAKFSMATSETYKNQQGEKVQETQWHSIVAWGAKAEFAEKYLKKGASATITGKLTYRTYEKDGEKKYYTEIVASEIIPHVWPKNDSFPTEADEPVGSGDDSDLPF